MKMSQFINKRIDILNNRSDIKYKISGWELDVEYFQEKIRILKQSITDMQYELEKYKSDTYTNGIDDYGEEISK